MFSKVTFNLTGAKKHYAQLEGKQYLVVPTVMLTVGVFSGSEGPLFYGPDEMGKNPMTWNHKPIVIDHPSLNGEGISACDPGVVENQKVGLLFNTQFDSRLKTESWLDEAKLKKVAPKILERLENNETIEVSTGLFHEPDNKPGTWDGKEYKAIVRNIQPDHLAILPDQVGACSVADGAGLLRNSTGEISYDNIREQLTSILRPKKGDCDSPSYYVYVGDVYPKYAVYEVNGHYYKIDYKVKEGKVSISGEPEEVRRVTSYVAASGEFLKKENSHLQAENPTDNITTNGNTIPTNLQESVMSAVQTGTGTQAGQILKDAATQQTSPRDPTIAKLIAGGGWKEDDRTFLAQLPDDSFTRVASASLGTGNPNPGIPNNSPAPTPAAVLAPSMNSAQMIQNSTPPAPLTVDQYIASLPPQVQELVRNGLAAGEAEKANLIRVIVSNKANRFDTNWLKEQRVEMLRGMASLAAAAQQNVMNYSGQGEVPMFIDNAAPDHTGGQQQVLQLPTMSITEDELRASRGHRGVG